VGERELGAAVDDSLGRKVPHVDNISFGKLAREKLEEAFEERGHANVLIAGRTGVGKSTLINSIFQGNLATTGQGRPVTENTREITKEDVPLSVFDTRGLEMADFSGTLESLEAFLSERRADRDQEKHIHVAWVCVAEDLRRVEEAETKLTEMLAEFVPVIGVITKARADQGFRADVQRLLPSVRNVVRVRAIPERFDDGYSLPPMGLEELVQLTMELFPEGQKAAFVAAQKADLDLKRKWAHEIVAGAATTAAGIGAIPIPFADAALIVPVQVGMLAGISAALRAIVLQRLSRFSGGEHGWRGGGRLGGPSDRRRAPQDVSGGRFGDGRRDLRRCRGQHHDRVRRAVHRHPGHIVRQARWRAPEPGGSPGRGVATF
jgi:hypothetical protein